jgi:Golgi nucleoside diphosphatase
MKRELLFIVSACVSRSVVVCDAKKETKPPMEDIDSWKEYQKTMQKKHQKKHKHEHHHHHDHRQLSHHHSHDPQVSATDLEVEYEHQFQMEQERVAHQAKDRAQKERKKHKELLKDLWSDPGTMDEESVHGLMVDAGSTGSRLHIYEWEPRVLRSDQDVSAAVSGIKLSFPGTESRWTDRLRPGLASFGRVSDDLLPGAIAEYLEPLLDFARTILHSKQSQFSKFPIFLRATAGMRILDPTDRARVMQAVRELFRNKTYCPFLFVDEQARVLSGEEEAIYDWTAVNFLLGDLLEQSEGAGTVINPKKTVGALDLGGGSTQIAFYEPNEDVMANLFKLQIGQAKHWNVYAHSFLFYGMNEAIHRFQARLVAGKDTNQRLIEGVYNPCLPGGSSKEFRTNIHVDKNGVETWDFVQNYPSGDGFYQAVVKNDEKRGDPDRCLQLTKDLLHREKNDWCNFAHNGDCSFAGVYQPKLPTQKKNFGEFVGFSNYYHVWKFLDLPESASIGQLGNATRYVCAMSHDELVKHAGHRADPTLDIDSYCFQSAYTYQLLHNGYGFGLDDTVRVTKVISGHKVGWALGAMLYEINSMPWEHAPDRSHEPDQIDYKPKHLRMEREFWDRISLIAFAVGLSASIMFAVTLLSKRGECKTPKNRSEYETIKEINV